MLAVVVDSSALAAVGYDAAGKLLQIEFSSRAIYQYFGVPAAVHEALLNSASKGSLFNRSIRGRFPYRRVSEGLSPQGGSR
jgi:hypothetical protein